MYPTRTCRRRARVQTNSELIGDERAGRPSRELGVVGPRASPEGNQVIRRARYGIVSLRAASTWMTGRSLLPGIFLPPTRPRHRTPDASGRSMGTPPAEEAQAQVRNHEVIPAAAVRVAGGPRRCHSIRSQGSSEGFVAHSLRRGGVSFVGQIRQEDLHLATAAVRVQRGGMDRCYVDQVTHGVYAQWLYAFNSFFSLL